MPFGKWKDFAQCVADNQDKENPAAWCAAVHKKITGKWPSENAEVTVATVNLAEELLLAAEFQGEGLPAGVVPILDILLDTMGAEELVARIRDLWKKGKLTTVDKLELMRKLRERGIEFEGGDATDFSVFKIIAEKDIPPKKRKKRVLPQSGFGEWAVKFHTGKVFRVDAENGEVAATRARSLVGDDILIWTKPWAEIEANPGLWLTDPSKVIQLLGEHQFGELQYILKNVPIFASGKHTDSQGKERKWSDKDLKSMLEAFDAKVPAVVPIKLGHSSDSFNDKVAEALGIPVEVVKGEGDYNTGAARLGEVVGISYKDGQLYADIEAANEKVADIIKGGYFTGVSSEIQEQREEGGKKYGPVLTGLALLGAQRPALSELHDVLIGKLSEAERKKAHFYFSKLESDPWDMRGYVPQEQATAPTQPGQMNELWTVPMRDIVSGSTIHTTVSAPDQASAKKIGLRALDAFLQGGSPIVGRVFGTAVAMTALRFVPGVPQLLKTVGKYVIPGQILFEEKSMKKYAKKVEDMPRWGVFLDNGEIVGINAIDSDDAKFRVLRYYERAYGTIPRILKVEQSDRYEERSMKKNRKFQATLDSVAEYLGISQGDNARSVTEMDIRDLHMQGLVTDEEMTILMAQLGMMEHPEGETMNDEALRTILGVGSDVNLEEAVKGLVAKTKDGTQFSETRFTEEIKKRDTRIAVLERRDRVHQYMEETSGLVIPGTALELATKLVDIEERAGEENAKALLKEWQGVTKYAEEQGVLKPILSSRSEMDKPDPFEERVKKYSEEHKISFNVALASFAMEDPKGLAEYRARKMEAVTSKK